MLDLSTRESLIQSLPHNGVVAEIGVDYGFFSEKIYELNKPSKLILVDCWEEQSEEVYGNDPANNTNKFKNSQFEEVLNKFSKYANVVICKEYSQSAAMLFPNDFFDWIYIDANHLQVVEDIIAWWNKVKVGGFILGHDYTMVGDYITVKRDIDLFIKENGIDLFITTGEGGDVYEKNYPTWGFKKDRLEWQKK